MKIELTKEMILAWMDVHHTRTIVKAAEHYGVEAQLIHDIVDGKE